MNELKFGLLKDIEDDRDILFQAPTATEFKDVIDLIKDMPEIWNQLNFNSCSAFAILRIFSYFVKNKFIPSKMFQYNNTLKYENNWGIDEGCTLRGAIKALNNNGVCVESLCKYIKENFGVEASEEAVNDAFERLKNLKFKYYRVSNSEQIYQAMNLGYVPYIGIYITKSFYSEDCMTHGIIPNPTDLELKNPIGGHALVISKVDYINRIFTIDNSWSEDKGIKGRFTCSFDIMDRLLMDAWALDIDTVIE